MKTKFTNRISGALDTLEKRVKELQRLTENRAKEIDAVVYTVEK